MLQIGSQVSHSYRSFISGQYLLTEDEFPSSGTDSKLNLVLKQEQRN